MGDDNYEKGYLEQKKRSREILRKAIETKHNQKIYHELMGSSMDDK